MREMNKPLHLGLALLLLASAGCYEFDEALQQCAQEGRCTLPDGGPLPEADAGGDGGGGTDGGDGGHQDAGCIPTEDVDLPDDAWQDTNCDGVDGTVERAYFVDPVAGNAGAEGSPAAPLDSLHEALFRANLNGREAIYVTQGTYNEPGLELSSGVSLYGGYTGVDGGWTHDGGASRVSGGTIGFTVRNVHAPAERFIVIDRLNITSAPGADAGEPSIGLRVISSSGLLLRQLTVTAMKGAPGRQGFSPAMASSGINGTQGAAGPPQLPAPVPVGAGGPLGCGAETLTGGAGGTSNQFASGGNGGSGAPGNTDGGIGGNINNTACSSTGCVASSGNPGASGNAGDAGVNGDAGSHLGILNGETWVAALASNGTAGQSGRSGGGGGGGAYCSAGAGGWGGTGGGGGSGGCGGEGGQAGGGGGASIGLLLLQSHVVLERVTVDSRGGGGGGAGGTGGTGGLGGLGADGGSGTALSTTQPCFGGNGGPGGHGGPGGPGGHGGNGGGGPSVALWCDNSTDSSALRDGGVRLVVVPTLPSAPGNGPGAPASPGLLQTVYGCQ